MVATGIVDKALNSLKDTGVDAGLFQEVEADPPEKVVMLCTKAAIAHRSQGVIGLGGGSSLDVAKLAALLAPGKEKLADAYGVGNAKGPRLPLVLVLPHVLRFNVETHPEPYAAIAPFAFPGLADVAEQGRACAFCDALQNLSGQCGLQQSLREMNIPEDALPKLADDAMNQTRLLVNNPRKLTRDDALAIYRSAF